ncbi:hypothetical protein KSF78_0007613 [Schistosoma japonicum]|nr:hypothetical protein KSF78_0007613 [Schistosoma japonicum]
MFHQLIILSTVVTILNFNQIKASSVISDENNFNITYLEHIDHDVILSQNPANPSCFGCKSAIWMAKTFVFGSKEFVHQHIEVTCTNMKNIYKPCKRILTEFLDYAYDLIYGYSSADLCALAGICPNPPVIDFCPLCLMSVVESKNILLSDAILTEIQSVFVHVCDYVRLEVQCAALLNEFYEDVVGVLKHVLEPHLACQLADICSSNYTNKSNYIGNT